MSKDLRLGYFLKLYFYTLTPNVECILRSVLSVQQLNIALNTQNSEISDSTKYILGLHVCISK